jgi:hypothetical protein
VTQEPTRHRTCAATGDARVPHPGAADVNKYYAAHPGSQPTFVNAPGLDTPS